MGFRIAVAVYFAILAPALLAQSQVPEDFGFTLHSRSCVGSEAIDTFKGTYVRSGDFGLAEARVQLSNKQRKQLFDRIEKASFFEMPEKIEGGASLAEPEPSTFTLEVRSGGRTHAVQMTAPIEPTEESNRAGALARDIFKVFRSMQAVKRLPKSTITICL